MPASNVSSSLPERTRTRLQGGVTHVADRDPLTVRSPFTGEEMGTVPACQPADVTEAVRTAQAAQSDWSERPIEERAAVLQRFADEVLDHREELLDIVQLEAGKARLDAHVELLDIVLNADYYAREGPNHVAPTRRDGGFPLLTKAVEHHDPVGVVGLIEPWNYPLTLAISDMLPALLAGNGAVLKPAEATPFCALRAVELLVDAGAPEDLVQVVTGHGTTLGEPLISSVDYVTFTGSTETGRTVASLAGEHLVDASMELGGKNAAVVLDDADLSQAVTGTVHGSYANAGQLCISFERIFVHEAVYDQFVDRFVDATETLDLGASLKFGPDVGSLIGQHQLDTVEDHVADARERGATVETGGRRREEVGPLFYEPTVLTDLPDDATAACEETFGPVVSITPVADADEAVARANDTDYGLHASVWTEDTDRGEALARRIEAGSVCVNDAYLGMWASTDAPMGGVGDSGIGRRHGPHGIQKYTESQTVTTQRLHPLVPVEGLPNRVAAAGATLSIRALRRLRRLSPLDGR
ncbi:succinic semialdehyde dehydrogenase [Haloarcula pellucida]|uniref:Succinic semialdehyde dehydrogenase n=1 Tax=Haloarcula pellucida TaxID=1427151 RepID=A0A830GP03_9EURY|nr:succinic semialdehyde dehydrogenase [Halomicroarcula pellucida]MBX0348341.1 succinate-semialdehyde dehydrogenase (NADP(+)) [Halomicroarcula pellucida]GGN98078.1 succinic semialdehyde dehydrogenase [Halomicroarcula pellucida]